MKTKFFILALLASFVYAVEAQEFQPQIGYSNEAGYKTNFKKNKARDNWFISIAGGASVLLGDQNGEADFKNRLNFAPQVSFGKWFNPYLAFRAQLNGGILHGFEGDNARYMQHNKYFAAHVDLLWDVTNFWAPYRESKVFRLIPWVGFGYAQRFERGNPGIVAERAVQPRGYVSPDGWYRAVERRFDFQVGQDRLRGIGADGLRFVERLE